MNTLNYRGKSTQQVINELSSLPQDINIEVTTWNGNVRETTVSQELKEMKRLQQEERYM